MHNAILDAALAVVRGDGVPVFPATVNKRPCCKDWANVATTDPDALARLFSDPRAALVAMPTGAVSGADVLDIDPRHGGLDWYEANKYRLPPTRTVRTRSGGLHLYFQHAVGLRNSVSRIAPGVDIRADGGFVIRWDAHSASVH